MNHRIATIEHWLGARVPTDVRPDDLRSVLEKRGYHKSRESRDHHDYFEVWVGPRRTINVPLRTDFDDYRMRVAEVLRAIRDEDIAREMNESARAAGKDG